MPAKMSPDAQELSDRLIDRTKAFLDAEVRHINEKRELERRIEKLSRAK